MDYIRQLNTFLNMSAGNLPGTPFNVYMRLFQIANMRGWPECFPASDAEICLMTGIRNKKTIAEARRVLEQAGYIKTIRGGKHQATQYHVVDLVNGVVIGNQNTPITTPITGAITTPITGHYIKHKRKTETKTKTDSAAAADACVREEDNSLSEVVRTFENNIHPVTGKIEQDALIDLTDEYGALWVKTAIEEAALSNGRSLRYITAILERWNREGFKAARKGVKQGGASRDNSREALEERYRDFAEADRNYVPPWKLRPPDGGDQAASGGDCGH